MSNFNAMGYRFHPTEEEIIKHFLERKMRDGTDFSAVIKEVDICKFEPWELPRHSPHSSNDQEWYFFNAITYKYANSKRIDRTTAAGYWKVTGKDREVCDERSGQVIGKRTALVFYQGHGSNASKTSWVMHEYHSDRACRYQKPYVLCRLKAKSDEPTSHSASTSGNRA